MVVLSRIMAGRGRTIPEGENREPRDKLVGVYFSQSEKDGLEKVSNKLGFKTKSALIAYVMEPLILNGFSAASFVGLARKFARLVGDHPDAKADFAQLMNVFKRLDLPEIETVNVEQSKDELT